MFHMDLSQLSDTQTPGDDSNTTSYWIELSSGSPNASQHISCV